MPKFGPTFYLVNATLNMSSGERFASPSISETKSIVLSSSDYWRFYWKLGDYVYEIASLSEAEMKEITDAKDSMNT